VNIECNDNVNIFGGEKMESTNTYTNTINIAGITTSADAIATSTTPATTEMDTIFTTLIKDIENGLSITKLEIAL